MCVDIFKVFNVKVRAATVRLRETKLFHCALSHPALLCIINIIYVHVCSYFAQDAIVVGVNS